MALSDLFSRFGGRKDEPGSPDADDRAPVYPTKALGRFLAALGAHEQPVLLDLGPVVGANVTFFGEHLGCKILVEDLFADIDRHERENRRGELAASFGSRLNHADASVDGILSWGVFDYLDRPAAQVLASELTRILRPEGVLLGLFATAEPKGDPSYTKHIVVDPGNLRHRAYPAARGRQRPLLNRDIIRMFEPLRVSEQFLLKNNLREVLFRKPAASAPPADAPGA